MDTNFSFEYKFRDSNKPNEISPIIIMLHGYGSNENDLFSFASHIPENYKIISLRAPYPIAYGGYSWYDFGMDDEMKVHFYNRAARSPSHIFVALWKDESTPQEGRCRVA